MPRSEISFFVFFVLGAIVLAADVAAAAADEPAAARPDYNVGPEAANIAPTVATAPHVGVEILRDSRRDLAHPDTLWDAEDIAHYKDMLKSSPELRAELAELSKPLDARLGQPLDIPAPRSPDGAGSSLAIISRRSPAARRGQIRTFVSSAFSLETRKL